LGGGFPLAWIAAAVVAVILLINFPRATVAIVGSAIAGLALMLWSQNETAERERREEAKILLEVDPELPSKSCSDALPIRVVFKNGSVRTLQSIHWDLEIRQRGHSTNLARLYIAPVMDLILKPGEKAAICLAVPELQQSVSLADMEPRAKLSYVSY